MKSDLLRWRPQIRSRQMSEHVLAGQSQVVHACELRTDEAV